MEKRLVICINRRLTRGNPSCAQRHSCELADTLEGRIARENLSLHVERVFCLGRCDDGPVLKLAPGGEFLVGMELDALMMKIRAFAAPLAQQGEEETTADQVP